MKNKTKKRTTAAILSAIILYYLIPPYFFWNNFFSSVGVSMLVSFLLAILFLVNRVRNGEQPIGLFLLFFGILILYTTTGDHNFNFFLTLLPCAFLPFATDEFSRDVYKWFRNIYLVLISISMVSWVLMMVGLMPSLGVIPPLNSNKQYDYIIYPLLVVPSDGDIFRFFGPFDEPGVVGTLSGIMLCIDKIDIKQRKTLILLMSGLLSFSFFFYVLIGVYFILYYLFNNKNITKTITIICLVIGAFILINNVPFLYNIIGSRFEWSAEKGGFVGDNRINNSIIEDNFDRIIGSEQFWWGIQDKESFLKEVQGSSSFLMVLIVNGVVFSVLYLLFYILYGLKNKENTWSYLLFLFVVIGTLYQRPNLYSTSIVFLFIYLARCDKIEQVVSDNRLMEDTYV